MLVGLASALVYGASDFVGGVASKRIAPERVVAVSAVTGTSILALASLLVPAVWSADAVLWGAASGVANSMAILLLYMALAIGPMSILSPLTALLAAVVPVVIALVGGEQLGPLGYLAIVIALVAVVLVGAVRGERTVRPSGRGLGIATASGVLIGLVIVLLDRAPHDSGLLPLLFNRAASGAVLLVVVVVGAIALRRRGTPLRSGWPASGIRLALVCGVLDTTANTLILTGLRLGELSVMSVLAALYPAGTIALAAIVLRERVSPLQWVGLGLAIAAAALLALA